MQIASALNETTKAAQVPLEDQGVTPDINWNCTELDYLRPIMVQCDNQAMYNKNKQKEERAQVSRIPTIFTTKRRLKMKASPPYLKLITQ